MVSFLFGVLLLLYINFVKVCLGFYELCCFVGFGYLFGLVMQDKDVNWLILMG